MYLVILFLRLLCERLEGLTLFTPILFVYAFLGGAKQHRVRIPKIFFVVFILSFVVILIGLFSAYNNAPGHFLYPLKSIIRYSTYFLILLVVYNSRINTKQFIYTSLFLLFFSYIVFYFELLFLGIARPHSLFVHSNAYAYFLVFFNIIILTNSGAIKINLFRNLVLFSLAVTILLTRSMGGVLTYTFSIIYLLQQSNIRNKKLKQILIISLLCLGAAIFLSARIQTFTSNKANLAEKIVSSDTETAGNSLNWRIVYWVIIIDKTLSNSNALFGNGIESASLVSPYFLEGLTHDPHNDYVRVFAETGLVGLTVYLTLLFLIARYLRKKKREIKEYDSGSLFRHIGFACIFYTLLIAQLPGNIIGSTAIMWFLWTYFGIVLRDMEYITISCSTRNGQLTFAKVYE